MIYVIVFFVGLVDLCNIFRSLTREIMVFPGINSTVPRLGAAVRKMRDSRIVRKQRSPDAVHQIIISTPAILRSGSSSSVYGRGPGHVCPRQFLTPPNVEI